MSDSFAQKYGPWAVVTGGTSGIGEAIVNQLAAKKINVVLVARRANVLETKAANIQKQHDVKVRTIQADLSLPNEYEKVMEATQDLEVGLFVPAAAIENSGAITGISLDRELALIQLNVTSMLVLTHHFIGKMADRGKGGVLLIASLSAHMPNPYLSNYAGSKAYALGFGTSLHGEMKKKGVDVTVLSPGLTSTPMTANSHIDFDKTPMVAMTPEKVAEAGLAGLGHKAVVIPGGRNKMMAFMIKHVMGYAGAISMGKNMMEKAIPSENL